MDRNCQVVSSELRVFVALRKESVDRNNIFPGSWILPPVVALRKESVDRNTFCLAAGNQVVCRSPQGERG